MEGIQSRGAAQLVREYEPPGIEHALHGATFGNRQRLWLASGHYLMHLAADAQRIMEELETAPAAGGLAFDGRSHIWQCEEDRLVQLDLRTGLVVRAVTLRLEGVTGIACIEDDHLLVLHALGRRLSRIRVEPHAFADEAVVTAESSIREASLRGLTWAGAELWSATADALVRIDPDTAHTLEYFALPDGLQVVDLTADLEGRLWCVDGQSRKIHVLTRPGWMLGERRSGSTRSPPSSRVIDVTTTGAAQAVPTRSPASVSVDTFERLLVPVDFSATSRQALAMAFVLQDRLGSEVHLLHLAQQGADAEFLASTGASISSADLAEDARARLIRFVENVFPGRSPHVVVHARVGSELTEGIESAAREVGATLVLLGCPARRPILRTAAEKVAGHLDCAVLLLRATNEAAES